MSSRLRELGIREKTDRFTKHEYVTFLVPRLSYSFLVKKERESLSMRTLQS